MAKMQAIVIVLLLALLLCAVPVWAGDEDSTATTIPEREFKEALMNCVNKCKEAESGVTNIPMSRSGIYNNQAIESLCARDCIAKWILNYGKEAL